TLVKNLKSRALSGAMTPNEALNRLLGGTGLSYRYLDDRTVTIYPAGEPSPDLTSINELAGDSPALARYLANNGFTLVRVAQTAPATPSRLRLAQVQQPPAQPQQQGEVEVISTRIDGLN